MPRYLFLTILVLILNLTAWGAVPAKPVKVKLIVKNDSTTVAVRQFDRSALKNYGTQPEFKYDESYVGESLWSRFWRWFWDLFKHNGISTSVFSGIVEYTFIALGVAALVFLIFKLAGVDMLNVIKGKSLNTPLPYDESVENIYAIDFEFEIEKATEQQNYRLAVRLLYLKALKQLSDANLIHWELAKTNSIYIKELNDTEQRLAFKLLTRQFEYVWYGELTIDAQVFKKISVLFANFKIKAK
jgi:hypothetical protein